ncbi:MAG: HPr(Ser) kinase/phosphatase [Agathobacter sp.]|nr:HPr(Ser) kinase/phosphatase [Agathobacter sp.]
MTKKEVSVSKIAMSMDLRVYTDELDLKKRKISHIDINRPALQMAGYFEHFQSDRVQVVGNVEYSYMMKLEQSARENMYREFLGHDVPCVIFCRSLSPDEMFIRLAEEMGIPVLGTERATSEFIAELVDELGRQIAPCITIHGVLVDVYGEGLLITGESGIGKSEAALELIRRGHRLVSDDVVEIIKVNDHVLIGSAPDITRHFIELRGIGIIDVKMLYGAECVKGHQAIDLVINLSEWKKDAEYDRLGLEENYTEYLGNKVVCHNVPIRPGRNVAVICEAAAVNHRQKKMGYNAAQELYRRIQANMAKGQDDDE